MFHLFIILFCSFILFLDVFSLRFNNEGNVKVRLSRARKLLKEQLKENWNDEE